MPFSGGSSPRSGRSGGRVGSRSALSSGRLRIVKREQDQQGYGYRGERKGERVEPPEGRQQTAYSRVARRPHREDAGVVSEGARALAAVVDVADYRDVEGTQCGGPHALEKAEGEEHVEVAGESAGAAGEAEKEEGGDQYLLPSVAVGEDAEERCHHDAWQGEERDQEPNLSAGDAELPHDGRKGRRHARGPEDRHQRHAPQDVEVVVFVDPANALVSLGLRSHDWRIYQVARRSEVGSGTYTGPYSSNAVRYIAYARPPSTT